MKPQNELLLPPLESLEPESVEILYDADLDEMTIYFHGDGKDAPHATDPVNEIVARIVRIDTDQLVGIQLSGFLKRVVQAIPESRVLLEDAAIIIGDRMIASPARTSGSAGLWQRAVAAFHGMKRSWTLGDDEDAMRRRAFAAIPTLGSSGT